MSNLATDVLYERKDQRDSFFSNFLCARPVIILPISKLVAQKKNRLLLLNLIVQPFTSAREMINPIGRLEISRSMINPIIDHVLHIHVCVRIMNRVPSRYYLRW